MDGTLQPLNSSLSSSEDQTLAPCNADTEEEEHPESFLCCICLDLLYKPVVLACGHISCFWCVHLAMSGYCESHCPLCRHPYLHFPFICQLLHSLLLKMFPVACKRREREVFELEMLRGDFSPQFDDLLTMDVLPTEESKRCKAVKSVDGASCHEESCGGSSEVNTNAASKESGFSEHSLDNQLSKQICVSDVLCAACKQMLFQPVVLNCGHAYCKTCIATSNDEVLTCQCCQSLHPGGLPKVCLELHYFLQNQFPTDYTLREEALQLKQLYNPQESSTACAMQSEKKGTKSSPWPASCDLSSWNKFPSNVNAGVGCDSCGMCPIIGKWYRCKDCLEKIGFDLCEGCYNTRSKLPGRFNQKHKPDHTFMLVDRDVILPNVLMLAGSLQAEYVEDDHTSHDAQETPEHSDSNIED